MLDICSVTMLSTVVAGAGNLLPPRMCYVGVGVGEGEASSRRSS